MARQVQHLSVNASQHRLRLPLSPILRTHQTASAMSGAPRPPRCYPNAPGALLCQQAAPRSLTLHTIDVTRAHPNAAPAKFILPRCRPAFPRRTTLPASCTATRRAPAWSGRRGGSCCWPRYGTGHRMWCACRWAGAGGEVDSMCRHWVQVATGWSTDIRYWAWTWLTCR